MSISRVSSFTPVMKRKWRALSERLRTKLASISASSGRIGRTVTVTPSGSAQRAPMSLGYGWIAMCP